MKSKVHFCPNQKIYASEGTTFVFTLLSKIMQVTECFDIIIVSVEIKSYDHWFELKGRLFNTHTTNNEEDFQIVKFHIAPKVDGDITYSYGRTKPLKKSVGLTFTDWLRVSQDFSSLLFAMSREEVLTKRGYGYICFPPEYSGVLTTEVRDTLNKLSSELTGVIVCNYDIADHFRLLKMDTKKIKQNMKVNEIPSYINRFLWFHPDGIIVNVRISVQEDAELIKKELIMCRDDLKLFCLMNYSMFESAGICITFLLVLLKANEETIRKVCQICTHNLVTIKDIKDGLSKFLERTKKEMRETPVNPSSEQTVKIFKTIISHVVASMAGSECESQSFLPVLRGNPEDRLSSLMLNPIQLSVLNSTTFNVKIVKGVYGAGKSIVGRALFEYYADPENHANSVNNENMINVYYVIWDPWSLLNLVIGDLEHDFMKKTKSNVNVKVVGKMELLHILGLEDGTPLLTVLQTLNSHHKDGNVYTVVDEFKSDGNDEIQSLLEEEDLCTTILVQPMMTHYVRDNVPGENECSESGHGKIFLLTEAMRTTKQVSSVLKLSQNVIEDKPTSYYLQSVVGESDVQESPNLNESAEATFQSPQVYNKVPTETKSSTLKENVDSHDLELQKSAIIELECCVQESSEHDLLDEKIELKCSFEEFKHLGHEISGSKLPTLYERPLWPNNETEIIERNDVSVAVNLNSIFSTLYKNDPNKPVTILCLNQETRHILKKSLSLLSDKNHKEISVVDINNIIEYTPFLDGYTHYPSEKDKEKVYAKFKAIQSHIFVTDIMAFRGLDCQNLIILIDRNQHQGRQFLAECIGRCTTNQLYMVHVTKERDEGQVNKQTIHHIIEELKMEKIIDTMQVSVLEKDFSVWKTIARTHEAEVYESEGPDMRHQVARNKYANFSFSCYTHFL